MNECTKAQIEAAKRIGYLQGYQKGLGDSIEIWERLLALAKMMRDAIEAYWNQDKESNINEEEESKPLDKEPGNG